MLASGAACDRCLVLIKPDAAAGLRLPWPECLGSWPYSSLPALLVSEGKSMPCCL